MQAIFRKGNYATMDYTPGSAVTAGDVIIIGGRVCIAHSDIAADTLGALAIGGGIYEFLATSGDTFSVGDDVYWDDTSNIAEATATGDAPIGPVVTAKVDGDTTVWAFHQYPVAA